MKLALSKSITFRLTVLFAAVSTTVLLLLGLLIASLAEGHFEELDMELLTGKLEFVRHNLAQVRTERDLEKLPQALAESLVGNHGLALLVLRADGRTLYASDGVEFPQALIKAVGRNTLQPTRWSDSENRHYRGIAATAASGIAGAPPFAVAVSTDLAHHEHFMHSFRNALWTAMGLAALLTGILGWLAARRGLAPLREIRRSAAAITANRLDQRLSATAIPVELAEVAETLNEMLARLEESFRRLSDFSSDLAHELRTPVTNLLTQTQVSLSRTRTIAEYQDVLASNAEEFERLSRIISDMLFLAKSDNKLIVPQQEHIDLSAEVGSLFEFYDALAEEKGISLSCAGKGWVSGDRLMLRRAVNNLLSNAMRHTPPGGRIAVRVDNVAHADDANGTLVVLAITNTGEAIAAEHLPRLFDRFYRVDASRQNFGEGAGLGLAITRSIAHAHGGETFVRSEDGATTFEIRLPN